MTRKENFILKRSIIKLKKGKRYSLDEVNFEGTYNMKLVQIFLPRYDNNKQRFDRSLYDDLRNNLKNQFGGVTFYRNTSAEGLWTDDTGKTNYDELIIAEVMIEQLDKEWWQKFKQNIEYAFRQEEILIRCLPMEKL